MHLYHHASISSASSAIAAIQAVQAPQKTKEAAPKVTRKLYPNYKVIVLNDDFNTFEYVAKCLMTYIPSMTEEHAWELTNQVHSEGLAIVWVGPQEQAELYHAQLKQAKLTMAPLESV
jgi:ATP-dependent Clp protease adaptor protein ClpS